MNYKFNFTITKDEVEYHRILFVNPTSISEKDLIKIVTNQIKTLYQDAKVNQTNEENI
jgi:hypothetical protein